MMVSARGLPLAATSLMPVGGVAEIVGGEMSERLIETCGVRGGAAQRQAEGQ